MNILALRRRLKQCAVLSLGLLTAVPFVAGQRTALSAAPATLPFGAVDAGAVPSAQPMQVTLYLAPSAQRQAALADFLSALQTPASGSYRAWLTPAQFAARFGAEAAQVQAVQTFAAGQGLSLLHVSGLRMSFTGSAAQMEAAFQPRLHTVMIGQQAYYSNTIGASVPAALTASISTIGGLSNLPSAEPITIALDGAAVATTAPDALAAWSDLADAGTSRVAALTGGLCIGGVDAATADSMRLALEQASAEGITVLAAAGCGTTGTAGLPGILAEVTSVAPAGGVTAEAATGVTELRPVWQIAPGLPADGLRHEPDLSVASLSAMVQTVLHILAAQPVPADGSLARLGNINSTLYQLAAEPGLYTQPDSAPSGTWEASTGLGLVSLPLLEKFYPHGSLATNVALNVSNSGYVTHGMPLTFSSTVTDTSGQGNGVVPTGTVSFATSNGIALGSATLAGGTASVINSQIPGGTYQVLASYSGDGTYAANQSTQNQFTIGPEAAQLTATAPSGVVGGTINVTITAKSASGVGTPSGIVTVIPQGTTDNTTYSGTLSGTGGTATAMVAVAGVQGGADVFKANCTTDTTFTCYAPQNVTVQVGAGTPAVVLTATPTAPTAGQTATLSIAASGKGGVYPTPTGNIAYYDNGVQLGSGTLSSGTSSFTTQPLTGAVHSFTATYGGDNNYTPVKISAGATPASASATTLALTLSPTTPVAGTPTTLTAALTYTLTNGAAPSGTVNFYQDGLLIGSGTLTSGQAQFSSSTLSGTTSHQYYAVYVGDTNYQTSTAPTVTTAASSAAATTTTLTINPNPPVSGSLTTLTATVSYIGTTARKAGTPLPAAGPPAPATTAPAGMMTFYQDGASLAANGVSNGVATYTSMTLDTKTTHTYSAAYSGDNNYHSSVSANVTTASTGTTGTTTTVASSASTVASGGMVTLSATVTPASTVTGPSPTGTVVFSSAQGPLCSATLSGATASCMAALTTSGTQSINATYNGDTNYIASTSAIAATVTVGATSSTGVLTDAASPSAGVMYGGSVVLSAALTPTTAISGGPAGTVTFTLAGTTTLGYTAALVSNGSTAAVATYIIPTPPPGTYIVTATCASSNVTCATLSATTALSVIKGNTTAILTASPTSPVVGQTTTLSATIYPAVAVNGAAQVPTGTVIFYINGVTMAAPVVNGTATLATVLTATTGSFVTAVYSGDTNYNGSNSSQVVVNIVPAPTSSTLTASQSTALYTANVVLTDNIVVVSSLSPFPISPSGTVTFYDMYGGQTTLLGTVNVTPVVLGNSVAQLTTTGLLVGTHMITALYAGGTTFAASKASFTVNITDYAVTFSPPSLNVSRGSAGTVIAAITSENGFAGQVVLGCTPPPGSGITCSFAPSLITGTGTSILTVQTTAATAFLSRPGMGRNGMSPNATSTSLAAISFASLTMMLLLPRRRRATLLLAMIAALAVSLSGCTSQSIATTQSTGGASTTSGTPLGTQILNITTQGTDGVTTVRHSYSYQVTVQ
jgi:hypothetical protein